MQFWYKHGSTSRIFRVPILDSSVTTGAGKTGLSSASSGMVISTITDVESTATVYSVGSSNVETITTLGTYQAPTSGKCRFKEVDATNHKGLYEIHLADARLAVSNATYLDVTIYGATNAAETTFRIWLTSVNPHSANGFMTGVNSIAPPTNWNSLSIDGNGRVDVIKIAGTAQTARDIGASVLLSVGTGAGQVNLSSGKVPATLAAADVTGNIPADLQTIKTQVITCGAGVTVSPYVGSTGAALNGSAVSTLDAAGVRAAVGMSAADMDSQLSALAASILTRLAASSYSAPLSDSGVRAALGMVAADMDSQLDALGTAIMTRLAAASYVAPLDAAGIRAALGMDAADLDAQLEAISGATGLDAAGVRAALGMAAANMDSQLSALAASVLTRLAAASYTAPLDAAGTRTAVGMSAANLDSQLSALAASILTRLASDSYSAPLNAAGVRAALGMESADMDNQLDTLAAAVAGVPASSASAVAATAVSGSITVSRILRMLLALMNGKLLISDSVAGVRTYTFYQRDNSTAEFTVPVNDDVNTRTICGTVP
jgi:hypothetical protein